MTDRLSYTQPVRPLVRVFFRAGALPAGTVPDHQGQPGPWASRHANEHHTYALGSPHVVTLTLRFEIGPPGHPIRTIVLERRVGDVSTNPDHVWRQFLFDFYEESPVYQMNPVEPAELNAIFDAHDAGLLRVYASVEVARFQFYDLMLRHFTDTSGGLETFAAPGASAASELERSVIIDPANGSVRHRVVTERVGDIGVRLGNWSILENLRPEPQLQGPDLQPFARVVLRLSLLVREGMDAGNRDTFARLVAGATFTSLYQGSNGEGPQHNAARHWREFLNQYLLNYVDLSRGVRVAQHIRARALGAASGPTHALINELRLAIDERLITANHWPDRREVEPEHHQRVMSLVLGDIHGHHVAGSPVMILRGLEIDRGEPVLFILALGVGHCGEHAQLSGAIVELLIVTDPGMRARLRNVIYSGRANVDHAFVLIGVTATTVLSVRPRTLAELQGGRSSSGERYAMPVHALVEDGNDEWAEVLDLEALLASAATQPLPPGESDVGYFLDPYLDPSAHAETNDQAHPERNSTLRTLLRLIQHGVRPSLRTRYVYFGTQSPSPPPVVTRLTGRLPNI